MAADESEVPKLSRELKEVLQPSESSSIGLPRIFRRLPIVCFSVALFYLLIGRLRFPKGYIFQAFDIDGDQVFTVFRHMKLATNREHSRSGTVVLVVRFRFARFTQAVNRRLSLIPIPLIAGFPGFHEKVWMVNKKTGESLGLYQWESERVARDYKRSFVLRLMTRRATDGSVSLHIVPGTSVSDCLRQKEGHP